jgi:hypothetical protein
MKLARQQFQQIQAALLDAYDRAGLRRMVRLGLDTPLEDITSGRTDPDVVFELIAWAERADKVPALIQAALAHNDQNRALQHLNHDAAVWFAPGGEAPPPAAPTPAAPPPAQHAGGDTIVANISETSGNVAVGKNIRQSVDDTKD